MPDTPFLPPSDGMTPPQAEAARTLALIADAPRLDSPESSIAIGGSADRRRFSIYEPMAAFALLSELDFLTRRSLEPNPFFAPQFLVPAMPRLDDRHVRLLVARDEDGVRSRLRLLMPFSIERLGWFGGLPAVRAWTHPFGPLGTLPLDGDDPSGTLASLFEAMRSRELALPPLLVLPDQRLDGKVVRKIFAAAREAGLPARIVERRTRASLDVTPSADFLTEILPARRRREFARQRRLLERQGPVAVREAREPEAVRAAMEDFLSLEASGWKGRSRSAMLLDRYRAAFAREAVNGLALSGRARVYSLLLGEATIASLVVFHVNGEAVLWKTAFDERFAAASPGFQLVIEASRALTRDPEIRHLDSCAAPRHSLMERVWRDRVEIGTLVIGLGPKAEGAVNKAARSLERSSTLRYRLWRLRRWLARFSGRR